MRQISDIFLPVHRLEINLLVGLGDQSFFERRALDGFINGPAPFLVGGWGEFIERRGGRVRLFWV